METESQQVKTGAQAWARDGFAKLAGLSVGLVANQTAMVDDDTSTLAALARSGGVKLAALFGPEHGAFGTYDDNVPDLVEPVTGLPICSLYGDRRKPRTDDLAGLDALVFEMQDAGARFYTYASTLGLCLEACQAAGIPLIVLDRPNPITGIHCEGPLADLDRLSFTAYHPIPVRHGLTLGEMARLYAIEKGCEQSVIVAPCEGLARPMWFDQTGLAWRNPSPAMRSLSAATLYPGVCLLEQTNFSVGRGTAAPFEIAGAPYVDSERWLAALSREEIAGVAFAPVDFTPELREFAGQSCHGIRIRIVDRDRLDAVRLGIALITTLKATCAEFDPSGVIKLLANAVARTLILRGAGVDEICASWQHDLARWEQRAAPARLYR